MSRPNWKKPAGLAAALVVLSSAVIWLEYSHKPKKEEKEFNSKRVLFLKDLSISTLTVSNGLSQVSFRCTETDAKLCKVGDNSKWQMTEPLQASADGNSINGVLNSISQLVSNEVIDLSTETPEKRASLLKEYKLDPTSRNSKLAKKVEIKTKEGASKTLFIGETLPIGDNLFVLSNESDSKVYLVPGNIKNTWEQPVSHWRDKKILAVNTHQIESFDLKTNQENLTAERKEGQWVLRTSKQGEVPGDLENIESLLNSAAFLNAKDFVSEDKKDAKSKTILSGAKAISTLTLRKEKGTEKEVPAPVTLTVYEKKTPPATQGGIPSSSIYATVSTADPLYSVELSFKDRLTKGLRDLRLVKLFNSMDRFNAKKLEFSGAPLGNEAIVLVQENGKWSKQPGKSPEKPEVASEKVQKFLDRVSGNRIKDFLTGSQIPTGQENGVQASLYTQEGGKEVKKRQLIFWSKSEKLYARDLLSKRNEAYLVDSDIKEAIPHNAQYFNFTPPVKPSGKP